MRRISQPSFTAIGNHDEGNGTPVNHIVAALILADKSDVRRTRVRNMDTAHFDIHDRVNPLGKGVCPENQRGTHPDQAQADGGYPVQIR